MTVALVQSKFTSGFGGTGAGLNLSFDAAVTTGNAVCVTFQLPPAAVISSVTAAGGNTFTLDKAAELNQQGTSNIYFYSCTAIAGTPTAVNIRLTTDESTYAFMEEVTGMATSSYVDVDPTRATGGTNTSAVQSLTTTTANVYVRAAVTLGGAQTLTGTGGFTAYPGTALSRQEVYNVDMGAAGSKSVTATIGAAEDWAVSSIGYKAAAGGSPSLTVSTPTAVAAASGGSSIYTFTMSASAAGVTGCVLSLSDVTAYTGTDYTGTLTSGMFSNGVTVSAGVISIPAGVTSFTLSVPIT